MTDKKLRQFGFLIGFGFPILIGWLLPNLSGHQFKAWTLFVGIPALILGIANPKSLLNAYKWWMKLGIVLGWINSRIILGLVFIFVLQPIALIMRCVGYNPLNKKQVCNRSYREDKKDSTIDLTRIF